MGALLTDNGRGLAVGAIDGWVEQIADLRRQGREMLLVSSGAVAEGMTRLGWDRRPHALHELQAAAAVGQMGLIQAMSRDSGDTACTPRRCCLPTMTSPTASDT